MDQESQSHLEAPQLLALLNAVDRLTSTQSLDEVLEHILAIGQELTASQAGSVILHDTKRDDLYFAAATGPTAAEAKKIRIPAGKGKAGTVFSSRLSLVENDLKDHYKTVDEKTHFVTHSMVCVPLVYADTCYGVLQLLNKEGPQGPQHYDQIDLQLTQRLASQATIAIRNALLFERMLASSGLYATADTRKELVGLVTGENTKPLVEQATILFADMRGFTGFCQVVGNNPTRIQGYLRQFFALLADAVLSHGGIVNKFLGDGLLAVFRGDDAPVRAVNSAFVMTESFVPLRESWQKRLPEDLGFLDIGVGIASDEVTIGAIGDDKFSEFTIIGGAVNRAALLERNARSGKRILCDGPTYHEVQELVNEASAPELIQISSTGSKFLVYNLRGPRSAKKQGKFFICHSHRDVDRIKELIVPRLDKYGFDYFLAEHSIPHGNEWVEEIQKAILASDYFLLVLSKDAFDSKMVRDEVFYAFNKEDEKPRRWVLPVLLEPVGDPSRIHMRLPQLQYKDLSTRDGMAEFEAALRELGVQPKSGTSQAIA